MHISDTSRGAKRAYETPELRDLGDVKTTTRGAGSKTLGAELDLDVPDLGSAPVFTAG